MSDAISVKVWDSNGNVGTIRQVPAYGTFMVFGALPGGYDVVNVSAQGVSSSSGNQYLNVLVGALSR